MDVKERKVRLARAQKNLAATNKRITRLLTAQRNWTYKVNYHTKCLAEEESWERAATAPLDYLTKHSDTLIRHNGRKFR